jgi:hypothetical protein
MHYMVYPPSVLIIPIYLHFLHLVVHLSSYHRLWWTLPCQMDWPCSPIPWPQRAYGIMKVVSPMPNSTEALKMQTTQTIQQVYEGMISRVPTGLDHWWDTCHVMKGAYIWHLWILEDVFTSSWCTIFTNYILFNKSWHVQPGKIISFSANEMPLPKVNFKFNLIF